MSSTDHEALNYMRQMTEAGRNAPLLGGRFYVFWGTLVALAYTVQWAVLDGRFGLPVVAILFNWLAFGAAAVIGMPLLIKSLRRKPGRGSVSNRVESLVWMVAGFGILAYAVGATMAQAVFGRPPMVWDFILAVAFAGYGTALLTTGHFAGLAWLKVPAGISLGAVVFVPVLAGLPEIYLMGASVALFASVVPGVFLMMREPRSLPEEA